MARTKDSGNGRLEEAITLLIQNQALFLTRVSEMDGRFSEMDRRFTEMDRRMARMEEILVEHNRILADHSRILQTMNDTIREKIGFKMPEQARPG